MKNKGINYTEDDYNKDKKIIEESTDKDGNLKISEENKMGYTTKVDMWYQPVLHIEFE